jgi:hypothetical protein
MILVVQIWPRQSPTLDWPPPYQFDGDSFRVLAVRIYGNRGQVVTKVTLKEAARRVPKNP